MSLPPQAPDSRFTGFLGPQIPENPGPAGWPLSDDQLDNFLHDMIAGITGIDNTLVRPRWQPEPPLRPGLHTNWVAFGMTSTKPDYAPVFIHVGSGNDGEGYDALQQMEELTILCTFYGPQNEMYASFLQRGLWVDQNQAIMRANAVGLVEVGGQTHAPELIKERFWPRTDVQFILRREVRYDYKVLNILRSQASIEAEAAFGTLDRFVDTLVAAEEKPERGTVWDQGQTVWDDGLTVWDIAP